MPNVPAHTIDIRTLLTSVGETKYQAICTCGTYRSRRYQMEVLAEQAGDAHVAAKTINRSVTFALAFAAIAYSIFITLATDRPDQGTLLGCLFAYWVLAEAIRLYGNYETGRKTVSRSRNHPPRSRTPLIVVPFVAFALLTGFGLPPASSSSTGVAATVTPLPAVQLETATTTTNVAQTHTVVHGDTLSGIAARWCSRAAAWPNLWHANQRLVPNPNLIYPGQRITLTCTGGDSHSVPAPASRASNRQAGWFLPFPAARCISGWGADRGDHSHKGVDLPARSGTPIHAIGAGTVAVVRYQPGGAGHYAILSHGGGVFSVYMHMLRPTPLRVGARVAANQVIGNVGATGNATTSSGPHPHLHFEIHTGLWHPIDPAPWLRAHNIGVGC